MQTPLKASPLAIEHHEFVSFHVDASEEETPTGPIALKTHRHLERHPEDPQRWKVGLDVEFGSSEESPATPYSGKVAVVGWFIVAKNYPLDKQQLLIEVTAVSILYGSCREMVAGFTARSRHGMLTLPSVTFPPISATTSALGQEPTKQKVRKGTVRKTPSR